MNDENSNDSNSMNTYDELLDEIGKNYMIGYTKEEINDLFNSIFNNIYIHILILFNMLRISI